MVTMIYLQLVSIMYVFSKKVPICAVFLHVALDISPKHLLLTIGTCSILVFAQVLQPDVSLAVGLVGEGALAGETGEGAVSLALTELVGCLKHCRCNRLKMNADQNLDILCTKGLISFTRSS